MKNDDINIQLLETAHEKNRKNIKDRTQQLYDTIRGDYKKMKAKKKHGVAIYTSEYIMNELAIKFFKSPKTVENIIFHRV